MKEYSKCSVKRKQKYRIGDNLKDMVNKVYLLGNDLREDSNTDFASERVNCFII